MNLFSYLDFACPAKYRPVPGPAPYGAGGFWILGKAAWWLLILVVIGFVGLVSNAHAQSPLFSNYIQSTYYFDQIGQTAVKQEFRLVSQSTDVYLTSFTLALDPSQVAKFSANLGKERLDYKYTQVAEQSGIKVILPQPSDLNVDTEFELHYQLLSAAKQKGKLWKIMVPIMQGSREIQVAEQKLIVVIPRTWGRLLLSTLPTQRVSEEKNEKIFEFMLESQPKNSELSMVFGENQIYDVELFYYLENPTNQPARQEIALPPEFKPFQQVFINQISPEPEGIEKDSDANILATYKLDPQEQKEVVFQGQIKIVLKSDTDRKKQTQLKDQARYLIADQYWEVNASEISKLADSLNTPEAIYNYVTENLTYAEDWIYIGQNQRAGALTALQKKGGAVCMEFTDLTITLMRAAGIPAREVDGYAYLEEDEMLVRPMVSDVLHTWVQYWEDEEGWINIDPTWGATTGRDYFNQFDHDHIVFVFKGVNSTYPNPAGSYRIDDLESQNVKVTLSDSDEPVYPSFDDWLEDFESRHQPLSLWQRFWQWLKGLLNIEA